MLDRQRSLFRSPRLRPAVACISHRDRWIQRVNDIETKEWKMARKVFFSFHFDEDHWRASQVRNMGALEGNVPCSDNDWESIKRGGDAAIKRWIGEQLYGKSCAVVLVGTQTANRPWVIHEIQEAWNAGKGVVGICIHNLKDRDGNHANKGANPFDKLTLSNGTKRLSS